MQEFFTLVEPWWRQLTSSNKRLNSGLYLCDKQNENGERAMTLMLTMLKLVTHSPQPFLLCFHACVFLTSENPPFQSIKEMKYNKQLKNKIFVGPEKNVFL